MRERGFRPQPRTGHVADLRRTVATGVGELRQRPLLLAFLGIAAAVGASSEGSDRLWEAHLLAAFTFPSLALPGLGALQPVAWFGIIAAVGSILSIVAAQALTRLDLADDRTLARWGLATHAGWMLAVCALGLAPDFTVAVAALWAAAVLRALGRPLMSTRITRSIPSRARATALSTLSQGDAFGQMVGGPVVGWVGAVHSLRAALVLSGLLHGPVLLLLTRARRATDVPVSGPMEPSPSSEPSEPRTM
jgi:hypothetical protein